MAKYWYTFTVTDFSGRPLTDAQPRARIEARGDAQGPDGTLSAFKIPVALDFSGRGVVELVASIDTAPQTLYVLVVDWITTTRDGQQIPWWVSEWPFYARAGGGDIRTMSGVPESAIHIGPPWPDGTPPGLYLNKETGDIGWKDPS